MSADLLTCITTAFTPPPAWTPETFAPAILNWFTQHGRHDLPWQPPTTPYRVWVSEIMLQQTQVAVVTPYFTRFVTQFPTLAALASAPLDVVLQQWSGLGYYARARHLHRAAQLVVNQHGGELPATLEHLTALPGIGRSTAGAILSLAYAQRQAILDGNVKRVLTRCFTVAGWPGEPAVTAHLWTLADQLTPSTAVADYTQAIMDLGATCCTRAKPDCAHCPLAPRCQALALGQVANYPAPRPRRALPVRQVQWLVLRNADTGEILLQQRPPSGIWGGLWTLPELPLASDAAQWCVVHTASQPNHSVSLAPRRHTFTHFHLDIWPIVITLNTAPTQFIPPAGQQWISIDDCQTLGIPAPLRRLLDAL